MLVRSFREPVAIFCTLLASLLPAASFAATHHSESFGAQHAPAFTFSIGHASAAHDITRGREIQLKPIELTASPKPTQPAFPTFYNPLHRNHMAFIAF